MDPAAPIGQTFEARISRRVKALEDELAALRRGRTAVTVGAGAPGPAVATPFYIDEVGHRLYWRESAGWRSSAGT